MLVPLAFVTAGALMMPYMMPSTLPCGVRVPKERTEDGRIGVERKHFMHRGASWPS